MEPQKQFRKDINEGKISIAEYHLIRMGYSNDYRGKKFLLTDPSHANHIQVFDSNGRKEAEAKSRETDLVEWLKKKLFEWKFGDK